MSRDAGVAISKDHTSAPCSRSSSLLFTVPDGTLARATRSAAALLTLTWDIKEACDGSAAMDEPAAARVIAATAIHRERCIRIRFLRFGGSRKRGPRVAATLFPHL